MIVNLLPSLARLANQGGWEADAARLIGAADAVSRASGLKPDPGAELERERGELATTLGEDQYGAYLEQGGALTTDEAVALASEIAAKVGRN
jgi:hypothetical protein